MEEEKKAKQLALGLDLGVASCGWSLLDITDPNHMQLVDLGVRLFDEASSDGNTKAAERRSKRSLRRRLRRLRFKKHNLLHLFAKYNLVEGQTFDEKVDNAKKIIENVDDDISPLDIKLKGLKEPLSNKELIIALYSYMNHRGFFYEVEDDATKKSKNDEEIKEKVRQELKVKRFPSLIQEDNRINCDKYMGVIANSQFSNKNWVNEINELFAHQNQAIITKEFQNEYLKLFTYIRPFNVGPGSENSPSPYGLWRRRYDEKTKQYIVEKIGNNLWDATIGKCSVYPNENRELKSAPITEIFSFVNDLNNVKALVKDSPKPIPFKEEQKLSFYNYVDQLLLTNAFKTKNPAPLISSSNFKKIIREICQNDELEYATDSIEGVRLENKASKLKSKDVKKGKSVNALITPLTTIWSLTTFLLQLGLITADDIHIIKDKKINHEYLHKLQELYHLLASCPQDKEKRKGLLIKYLTDKNVKVNNELIDNLLKFVNSFSNTAGLSVKAMYEFITNNWNTNLNESAYFNQKIISNLKKIVKPSKYLNKNILNGQILSVNAKRIYVQAINVINKILKLWCHKKGYQLASITIEMARDKNSKEQRNFIKEQQNKHEEFRKEILETLNNSNFNIESINNGQKFLKLLLWSKQDYHDIYDGSKIDLNDLLSRPQDYQIDHIIPWSISGIDSIDNKVLTSTKNNQIKGNRTPYQFLGSKFGEFKNRVLGLYNKNPNNMSDQKRDYLLSERNSDWEGFIGRNLSDTRYGTKVLLNSLQAFFDKNNSQYKTKIIAVNGAMTHYARYNLFTDNDDKPLILEKSRLINNHHAIDATIIAYLGNNYTLKLILEQYRKHENNLSQNDEFIDPQTGEVLNLESKKDIGSIYGLKSEATKQLGMLLNRISNNADDKFYVKFSRPLFANTNNFGLFDETIYRYKKINNQKYSISKINLLQEIDASNLKKWTKYFSNDKKGIESLVFNVSDPIYLKLKSIFNDTRYNKTSKDQKDRHINPFLNYVDELRKDGIINSSLFIPIYKNNANVDNHPTYIRFLRVKSTISSFYGEPNDKNGYKWIKTNLNSSSVRIYKNKNGKIILINVTVKFLIYDKNTKATKIDENKLNEYLVKENIDPNSKYFTLYYGSSLLLNDKLMEKIRNAEDVNNKALSNVIPKISFNSNYIRLFSLGTANTPTRIGVKLLNISIPTGDKEGDTKIFKDPIYLGLDFLNDYVDYVELDPLGNIYNRKSFKQIFTELGIPQNN